MFFIKKYEIVVNETGFHLGISIGTAYSYEEYQTLVDDYRNQQAQTAIIKQHILGNKK